MKKWQSLWARTFASISNNVSLVLLYHLPLWDFSSRLCTLCIHSRRRLNFTVNSIKVIGITIPSDKIAINDGELRAKQLTDNLYPLYSQSGETFRKTRDTISRERTIIDTCVVSRRQACWQLHKKILHSPTFLYPTLIAKYTRAGTRILRRYHVEMREIFFLLPLKREKRIPYKIISNISMAFHL